jgi:hypothetical protein
LSSLGGTHYTVIEQWVVVLLLHPFHDAQAIQPDIA